MRKNLDTRLIKKRITKARKDRGLTQCQLAQKTGITPASICLIEQGKRIPTISVLYRIAQILMVSLDYLVGREDKTSIENAAKNPALIKFFRKYQNLTIHNRMLIENLLENMQEKKR